MSINSYGTYERGLVIIDITMYFPPDHTSVIGNDRADVLARSAEIRCPLNMDPSDGHAAVQEMLTATRA